MICGNLHNMSRRQKGPGILTSYGNRVSSQLEVKREMANCGSYKMLLQHILNVLQCTSTKRDLWSLFHNISCIKYL